MDDCPFCQVDPDCIWIQNDEVLALKDRYPVAEGHTLVLPVAHHASLFEAPASVHVALWWMVAKVRESLIDKLSPNGFTVGINDGRSAGQTVMHGHIHIIPRFDGDVDDPRGGIRWVLTENAIYWRNK